MKANLNTPDKIVRITAAIVIAVLYFAGIVTGQAATILMIVAAILLVTALINFCPVYHLLKISTKKKTIQLQEN